jgi:hypothetical protein
MLGGIRAAKVAPVGWLIRVEHLLTQWRQGWYIVTETAVSAVAACSTAAVSTRRTVAAPDSGDIVLVVRTVGIFRIGGQYASATLRESAG